MLELVTLVKDHLSPKSNVISERFKFKQRKQSPTENIGAFVAALKQLSLRCEFGDNLSHNLRDQLVLDLRSKRIQRRLLTENNLTYERAEELSLSLETAEKEAESLSQSTRKEGESISWRRRRLTSYKEKGTGSMFLLRKSEP